MLYKVIISFMWDMVPGSHTREVISQPRGFEGRFVYPKIYNYDFLIFCIYILCPTCADTGARTPIGTSRNLMYFCVLLIHHYIRKFVAVFVTDETIV